ncbi:MAG: alpha/beta fold hydrolase [Bradymonadaceae bacterium]
MSRASIESRRVEFDGATGADLAARLDVPRARSPKAYALFAHCFTCSKDVFAASRISKSLAAEHIATLRFDFTGLGHSDGEFAHTNFSSNVEDLLSAADFLAEEFDEPSLLVGHSLGGAAALMAGSRIDGLDAVATVAAPFRPAHVEHLFDHQIDEIRETGEAEVTLAGRKFRIREQFLEDLRSHEPEERIAQLELPLMIFHGPLDNTVGVDNAARIFEAAKHPKSFVSLDRADHLLSREEDAEFVGNVVSAWVARYLDDAPGEPAMESDRTHVRVAETDEGTFQNQVDVGPHTLWADEPAEHGGDDTGPSPYEYVSAGLGACTSMTLRMYADRKDWPLERVAVELRQEKIHAEDCDSCERDEGKIDRFERVVEMEGDLDEQQRERMLEIADKCPVHNTLTGGSIIRTREADADEQ